MMKKTGIVLVSTLLLVMACGNKSPEPQYAPDSKEYEFFKTLSEKVPVLNPDESNELISTKNFSIYTGEIMPNLYRMLSRYANNLDQMPIERLKTTLQRTAVMEAEKRILLAASAENSITVPDDSVEAAIQNVYASQGGEEAFTKNITTQGLTIDFIKNDIKNSMLIQKFLDDIVFSKGIEVNDMEVGYAYEQDKYATVRHILMKTQNKSESEKLEIRKKMKDILVRARSGEDFAELAKQYTEDPGSKENGGLYENFPHGRMVKPFEDASFELPIGSISDIVETEYGYHIIKVISRSKETRPYPEVKEEIRKQLIDAKKRVGYRKLLESLKQEYEYEEMFT
jgi:foldase protein PrsA